MPSRPGGGYVTILSTPRLSERLHWGNAVSALLFALILSMADSSAATTNVADGQRGKPAVDPNKIVCREGDNAGSHVSIRTCKTLAQWDEDERRLQRFMRDVHHNAAQHVGLDSAVNSPVP